MFLKFFGLNVHPFGMSPRLDFLYKSTAFEESMAHLVYGLDNSEAIVLITGPIGSGKTMSLQSFLTDLGDNYLSALITNTQVTTVELLKLILEDLGVGLVPGWDKSDVLIAFKEFLHSAGANGKKVVVVIDEAQNLSTEVLEEVRLLTNLGQGVDQPVQLILVGQPELKEIVNRPELAQLRQRIRVHYEVETLGFEEMVGYVNHRMVVAGCEDQVFETKALEKLYELSGGIPRLVNTHAGDALLSAFVEQRTKVGPQDFEEETHKTEVGGGQARTDERGAAPVVSEATRTVNSPPPQVNAKYAHRADTRRGNSRWRIIWYSIAFLALAASGVWYTMFRDGNQTRVTEAVVVVPSLPPVKNEPKTASAEYVQTAALDSSGAETSAMPEVIQQPIATPGPEEFKYFSHVASFRDSIRSQVYIERLQRQSLTARVEKQVVSGAEWYRVYIGPVDSEDAAEAMAQGLLNAGEIEYYRVVRRLVGE